MSRPDWDSYFMRIAYEVATRATCDRKHVGCVIVRDRVIITTGYNGSPPGMPHCDDVGHDMVNNHCVRTTHAEINAVAQAAQRGVALHGANVYVNTFPCWNCMKVLATCGIKIIFFDDEYRRDPRVEECAQKMNVTLVGPQAWKIQSPPF